MNNDQSTFHRHLIDSFDLTNKSGEDRWKAYNFVRKLYDHFVPIHLKRIRDAVVILSKPKVQSTVETKAGSQTRGSQQMPPPSHMVVDSRMSSAKMAPSLLVRQLEERRREHERQMNEKEQQLEERMQERQRQMSEQEQQLREQMERETQ